MPTSVLRNHRGTPKGKWFASTASVPAKSSIANASGGKFTKHPFSIATNSSAVSTWTSMIALTNAT